MKVKEYYMKHKNDPYELFMLGENLICVHTTSKEHLDFLIEYGEMEIKEVLSDGLCLCAVIKEKELN